MSEIDEIRARHERDYPNRNWQEEVDDVSYLLKRNTELQAKLRAVRELPGKWTEQAQYEREEAANHAIRIRADELKALLNKAPKP